jgi:RNA polymerase sigma factor (sigma-70 family)
MASLEPFTIDELLTHAGWLRRLAVHIVRSEEETDDVLQETWTAALRAPPGRELPARPWLAQVLRNAVRRAGRDRATRRLGEHRAASAETAIAPSPEALLERAEAQRMLATLVMQLQEPFRSTVLLRYFEGLSSAEISRMLRVPAGTIRWRLKKALELLRAEFSSERGNARNRSRVLLLALPLETGRPDHRPFTNAAWKWGIILSTKKNAFLAMAVVCLLLVAGLAVRRLSGGAVVPRSQTPIAQASHTQPPRLATVALPTGEVAPSESLAGTFEGQVVSALNGSGVPLAELTFSHGGSVISTMGASDGYFRFAPAESGSYELLRIASAGYVSFSAEWGNTPISFVVRPRERISGIVLALRPLRSCRGHVIGGDGKPVAGATITAWMPTHADAAAPAIGRSDADGGFEFVAIEGAVVEARQAGRVARVELSALSIAQCALSLRLGGSEARAVAIKGQVVGVDDVPIPDAVIEARANPMLWSQLAYAQARVVAGSDGCFELRPLQETDYSVTANSGGLELARAEGIRGGTPDLTLRVSAGGRLTGRVRDQGTGKPVTSFSVVILRGDRPLEQRLQAVRTYYDANGEFDVAHLPAGSYHVMAVGRGYAPSEDTPVEVQAEPASPAHVTFDLRSGGGVQGRVVDRATGMPLPGAMVALEGRAGAGARLPLSVQDLTDGEGRFRLRGVSAGPISLVATAGGHHGRVLGAIAVKDGEDSGPLTIDLAAVGEGEEAHVELVGIGAGLGRGSDSLQVLSVAPNGGAAEAGLAPGDSILDIEGTPVDKIGYGGALQMIRGAEGTPVALRVRRAGAGESVILMVSRRRMVASGNGGTIRSP